MYDLIIIGGGPAGYHAAEKAGENALKTLLIEKESVGGVCLNEGCIPSKTLLKSSKLFSSIKNSEAFGVTVSDASFNLSVAMARKAKVIDTLKKGILFTLKKCGVEIVEGSAKIINKEEGLFIVEVNGESYSGSNLLVATGSEPVKPPIPGADKDIVVYNKEVLSVEKLPENFVVVGGGVIGLELATFFAECGSNVTVIEMLDSVGGPMDGEMSKMLAQSLKKKKISIKTGSMVKEIKDASVVYESKGKDFEVDADLVLMSIGRKACAENIGLEKLGVEVEKGCIKTDKHCETNINRLFAAGDVNGRVMLAHTAYREADVVVNNIMGTKDSVNYATIPSVVFTHPEAASVGYTKEQAEALGLDIVESKLPMTYNGRYLAEVDRGRGFCKVVINSATDTVVGAHMVGEGSSELIFGAAILIENRTKVEDIDKIVFPHPTLSEILKDTILSAGE